MRNYRLYGNTPHNIAVIHGGPGAPGSVAAIARELSKKNYGIIEPIQTKRTLEGQVLELHEVLRNQGEGPTTLIGHSWGAWLAYIFATRFPTMVKKLILVSSGPFEDKFVNKLQENRLSRLTDEETEEFHFLLSNLNDTTGEDKDNYLSRLGEIVSKTDDYQVIPIETDITDLIKTEGDTYSSVWNEATKMRASGELIELSKLIECPVLAIHGDYDPHPEEGVRIPLTENLDNFRFILLEKCGHSPWKEKYAKDRFYGIILNELE